MCNTDQKDGKKRNSSSSLKDGKIRKQNLLKMEIHVEKDLKPQIVIVKDHEVWDWEEIGKENWKFGKYLWK